MRKVFFLLLVSAHFFGQDTIQVSKNDLESRIEGQNLSVKLANDEVKSAQASLLGSRAMYLPNVTASYTGTATNSPLMAFGTKLNQSRITMMDFDPSRLNNPNNIFNFATKLEVQQPIFNKDAIYQKKAGEVKVDVLKIKEARSKEYLQFELKKAYLQLQMAYKVVKVLEDAKNTTLANKKVVDNYYKNGMIQKSEVLYMQVRVSEIESQIEYAKSNVNNASDYIYYLLNEDSTNKVLKPTDEFSYHENILEKNPTLNENRKDLQAYQKSLEAYKYLIKSADAKFLPKLNAFVSFEFNDNKVYKFGGNGYLVGVQLSWNVFDGLKAKSEKEQYKADLSKTQTEIEQYQKQNQLELNKSYRQVLDADNKVALTKLSWKQSQEAYRIRKNRFDQGLEKSSELLSAETQMSQKELEYQQAIFEYNTALEYYKFLKN
jgi:outer membrane protein TolC